MPNGSMRSTVNNIRYIPWTDTGASEKRTNIGANEIAIIAIMSGITGEIGAGDLFMAGILPLLKRNLDIVMPKRKKINSFANEKVYSMETTRYVLDTIDP
jgi:hypothetical protein